MQDKTTDHSKCAECYKTHLPEAHQSNSKSEDTPDQLAEDVRRYFAPRKVKSFSDTSDQDTIEVPSVKQKDSSHSEPPQDTSLDADLRKILGESTRDGYTFMIPYEILVKRLKAYNSSLLSQQRAKLFEQIRSEVIKEDEKEFTKRSRPYSESDTDKLWDLANGIEPISTSEFSTWGSSANAQFRKFALKLRNTIWKEAELHKNELRAEQLEALNRLELKDE